MVAMAFMAMFSGYRLMASYNLAAAFEQLTGNSYPIVASDSRVAGDDYRVTATER